MTPKLGILTLLLCATWVYGAIIELPFNSSLVAIPDNIPNVTNILKLSDHNIATLTSGGFSKLKNLLQIVMRRNIISTIEKDAFKGLDHLLALDLSYNKLSSIQTYYFDNIPGLKELNLQSNAITSIAPGSLLLLQNLERLNLNGNQLTVVPWGELRSLSKLKMIDLNSNNLWAVPEGVYTGWTALQQLFFHDNPFHCDCRLRWLKKFIQRDLLGILSYRCATPKSLKGAMLATVPAAHLVCSKASITQWEGVVSVKLGAKAVLICQADGDPVPEIAWTTPNGTTIKQGESVGKTEVGHHGTLMITKTASEDGGVYVCTASNAGGQDTKVTKLNIGADGKTLAAASANVTAGFGDSIWKGPGFDVAMGIIAILALTLGLIGVGVFVLVKGRAEKEKPDKDEAAEEKEAEKQGPVTAKMAAENQYVDESEMKKGTTGEEGNADNNKETTEEEDKAEKNIETAEEDDNTEMEETSKGNDDAGMNKDTTEKEEDPDAPPPLQVSDMGNV